MSLAAPATPFPFIHASAKRRKNVWYSTGSGNWTDPTIWMSNALTPSTNISNQYPGQGSATYVFPRVGDDVYIGFGHTVTCNTNASLNNLYVTGSLLFDAVARTITLAGDIQATGTVNMSNAAHNLTLYGVNNYVVNFNGGTAGMVAYYRVGDQNVMNVTHRNVNIGNSGIKYLTVSTALNGALAVLSGATLECGVSDLTVGGTTTVSGTLTKSGAGNVLFTGLLQNGGQFAQGTLNFSTGNPTVELRGGILAAGGWPFALFSTGTSQWKFTTNNQTITGGNVSFVFDAPILISGAITLQTATIGAFLNVQINNSINGDNANSRLLNGNSNSLVATLILKNTTVPMATGIFDILTWTANVVSYSFNGNYTLPLTSYSGLNIDGTGTKTLSGNTTLNYTLRTSNTSVLECSTYDLTVTNTTIIGEASKLRKTGSGNILFIGVFNPGFSGASSIDFSGNPTVELRGGINFNGWPPTPFITGSGIWSFTTNNQIITASAANISQTFSCPILISGAITLTAQFTGSGGANYIFTNTINGNNAASTLDNRLTGASALVYQATQQPMLTGVLQTNAAANTFIYNAAGNQDVTGGTYRTLQLAGSGVKTLQGNVVVATAYTLTAPATLNLNGFTRT